MSRRLPLLLSMIAFSALSGCSNEDKADWQRAENGASLASYAAYVRAHAEGEYVEQADLRIRSLAEPFLPGRWSGTFPIMIRLADSKTTLEAAAVVILGFWPEGSKGPETIEVLVQVEVLDADYQEAHKDSPFDPGHLVTDISRSHYVWAGGGRINVPVPEQTPISCLPSGEVLECTWNQAQATLEKGTEPTSLFAEDMSDRRVMGLYGEAFVIVGAVALP